jgi:sortase A
MTETLTPEKSAEEAHAPSPPAPRRRPWVRRLGTGLIVLGILALLYGAAIYFWRDPATDLFARWRQSQLQGQLAREAAEFRTAVGLPPETAQAQTARPEQAQLAGPGENELAERELRRLAQRFFDRLELGQPLGRLVIPKLGLETVAVNGTRWGADLSRGPGRYTETSVPGLGRLTAIAGHRTTFGAPFRHIDDLARGDTITLELPYGDFTYRVFKHEIVDDEDWSIIRERGFDTLVLSACHPLFSASQRWIVYARLEEAQLPDGAVWRSAEAGETAP